MRAAYVLLGLAFASHLCAQQTALSGPVEAITFDAPTRSLRAVFGFPGASSFGPALMDSVDLGSVAPRQNYGIIFDGGKCLSISGLNSGRVSRTSLPGVTNYPEGLIWSADGSVAVLFSRSGHWIQVISGFPASPIAAPLIDLSSVSGSFSAIAADSSGKQIAIGFSGDSGAVYLTNGQSVGGQLTTLMSVAEPVSLSFSADGNTLFILDAANAQVALASTGGQGFQVVPLPGLTDPVAIQSVTDSQNRQLLYVAGGSDRLVRVVDTSSQQAVTNISLGFEPTSLDPFGKSSFVLASRTRSANPLWLFSSTPQLGAYFVPAVQLKPPDHKLRPISGRNR